MKNDNEKDDDDRKTIETCALNHLKANNHLDDVEDANDDDDDDDTEDEKASNNGSSEGNPWPKAAQSSDSSNSKVSNETSGYFIFLETFERILASILIEERILALITNVTEIVVNAEQPSGTPILNTVFVRAVEFIANIRKFSRM